MTTHGFRARFLHWCEVFLLASAIAGALASVVNGLRELQLPVQSNYEEGNVLNAAVRITHGLTPYPDPRAYPNVLNPYGPVPYYLMAIPVKFWGLSFTVPRLLILGCGVLISLLLVLLVRCWAESWLLALGFGLFYLCTRTVHNWLFLLRVDLIAAVLTLAGFCVFALRPRRWAWAVLLFAAALFTKQTALAAPAACFLYLLAQKEWRRAAAFAALLAGLGTTGLVAMHVWTHGAFTFMMFRAHPDPSSLRHLWMVIGIAAPGLLLVAPLGLALLLVAREKFLLARLYLILATALVLITASKEGSSPNHFLEPLAVYCLCAALTYQQMKSLPQVQRVLPLIPVGLGIAALYFVGVGTETRLHHAELLSGCPDIYQYVRAAPGQRILSEDISAVLLSGKPVQVSNPFVYTQLVEHSGFSKEPVEGLVERQEYDLIVVSKEMYWLKRGSSDRWWPSLAQAMVRNYRVARVATCFDGGFVLAPRGRQP